MTRREIDPTAYRPSQVYRLLTAVVVPRPIAWVSSRSADGVDNLAPHSFFTVACSDPPIVQFTSIGVKDTLRNVRATREFIVHLAPLSLIDAVNLSGADQPALLSEFDVTGLEREPALVVGAARVAASPVAIECRLHATLELGDSTLVLGRVVHIALDEEVLEAGAAGADHLPHPDVEALAPLARLGRDEWGLPGPVRRLTRPRHPGGRDAAVESSQHRSGAGQSPGGRAVVRDSRAYSPAMTDATDPQSQRSLPDLPGDPTLAVRTGIPQPSPEQLNSQLGDGGVGDAVSAQPTDDSSADLLDARERSGWDEDTDDGAGQRRAERGE